MPKQRAHVEGAGKRDLPIRTRPLSAAKVAAVYGREISDA